MDKGFCRWPPHVNLLYPFVEDRGGQFEAAAAAASAALQPFAAFEVTLRQLHFFDHGRSSTLWLEPEAEALGAVQAALAAAFPACTDLSDDPRRGITRFVPHLSLGQCRPGGTAEGGDGSSSSSSTGAAAAEAAAARLGAAWQPLRFTAGGVALISRAGFDDPFTMRYWVPFGGAPPVPLDRTYFATVGEGPPPSEEDPLVSRAATCGRVLMSVQVYKISEAAVLLVRNASLARLACRGPSLESVRPRAAACGTLPTAPT